MDLGSASLYKQTDWVHAEGKVLKVLFPGGCIYYLGMILQVSVLALLIFSVFLIHTATKKKYENNMRVTVTGILQSRITFQKYLGGII